MYEKSRNLDHNDMDQSSIGYWGQNSSNNLAFHLKKAIN